MGQSIIIILATVYFIYLLVKKFKSVPRIEENKFCIKVSDFDDKYYIIYFSNNGDKTRKELLRVIDLSDINGRVHVSANPFLFRDKQDAIECAKRFDTYEKCVENNKKVYEEVKALIEEYKINPPVVNKLYSNNKKTDKGDTLIYCN